MSERLSLGHEIERLVDEANRFQSIQIFLSILILEDLTLELLSLQHIDLHDLNLPGNGCVYNAGLHRRHEPKTSVLSETSASI